MQLLLLFVIIITDYLIIQYSFKNLALVIVIFLLQLGCFISKLPVNAMTTYFSLAFGVKSNCLILLIFFWY